MADEAEAVKPPHGLGEADAYAAVPVAGEGQAPVGDAQPRGPGGLDEVVGAGDGDVGDVGQRRLHEPGPVPCPHGALPDLDAGVVRAHPERQRGETVGLGEGKGELHGGAWRSRGGGLECGSGITR